MQNIWKAHGIVLATKWTKAGGYHVNIGGTEPKGGIPVELHNPTCLDGADSIKEEPDI